MFFYNCTSIVNNSFLFLCLYPVTRLYRFRKRHPNKFEANENHLRTSTNWAMQLQFTSRARAKTRQKVNDSSATNNYKGRTPQWRHLVSSLYLPLSLTPPILVILVTAISYTVYHSCI